MAVQATQLQGVMPDVIIYNAAISACEKGKQAMHGASAGQGGKAPERAMVEFETMLWQDGCLAKPRDAFCRTRYQRVQATRSKPAIPRR